MIFSPRPRIHIFAYRGWRPLRALAIVAAGILAGFIVAERNAPSQPPAVVDCAR